MTIFLKNYLLTTRELEFGSPQGLNGSSLVVFLASHRHNGLSNMDTGNCALWLSKSTSHSSLEPRSVRKMLQVNTWRRSLKAKSAS